MRYFALCSLFIALLTHAVDADVAFYTNRGVWAAATGHNFTNIGFWELQVPPETQVTNQYSHLGITFVDSSGDFIIPGSSFHDGWGLYGNLGPIEISLSEPMYWIGADATFLKLELFFEGQLLYTTPVDLMGNPFAGVISDQPFNFVRITSWINDAVYIDDLSFGPPIPAPGALALAAIAGAIASRRRRPK